MVVMTMHRYQMLVKLRELGPGMVPTKQVVKSQGQRLTLTGCIKQGLVYQDRSAKPPKVGLTELAERELARIDALDPKPFYAGGPAKMHPGNPKARRLAKALAQQGHTPPEVEALLTAEQVVEAGPPPEPEAPPAHAPEAKPGTTVVHLKVTLEVPVRLSMSGPRDAQAVATATHNVLMAERVNGYITAYEVTAVHDTASGNALLPAPKRG